jgi:uncharacterized protein (DUF58 family)
VALTGRAALLAVAGLVPIALVPGWPVFLAWLALVLVLILLDLALAGTVSAVHVQREATGSVRLGEPIDVPVLLANTGRRRVRGVVRDGWQPSAGAQASRQPVDIAAGQRVRVTTTLRPDRRGDRRAFALTIRAAGPLGLAARQRSLPAPGVVRVLPPFGSRKHLPSKLARLRELDGRTAVMVRGQGTEFDSLRDYVAGDDVRSIDWRATARRQGVVVRTWRPERDRRVLIVLDTSRTSAARVGTGPRLDAAMDAALLLSALASHAGDRVDLLAIDRRIRARVEGATRADLLPRLVNAMAPLEASLIETDWSLVAASVLGRARRRSLIVVLTSLEAAAIEEGLLPVLPRLVARHQVVVASVADPAIAELAAGRGDAYAVYGAAAAARSELDRQAVTGQLRRMGVEVIDAAPAALPPQLADRYLALKAAGRL